MHLCHEPAWELWCNNPLQGEEMDPSSKRAAKLEQFKATKALNVRLGALEELRSKSMKNKDEVSTAL
jgi:hypothetical protein